MTTEIAAPPGAPSSQMDGNKVISVYKEMQSDCTNMMNKIAELEVERNEHMLVEKTMRPLDESRRAFRLIGDVLVERTVGEVLPSVETNRKNIDEVLGTLSIRLKEKQQEAANWKVKYNIRTQEEVDNAKKASGSK
eukprot:CAMPEP_0194280936 /NCGR_PEP_ID=MMETSP0169-20130528/19257_1 /TAXON_ID=218684 /ORGANISM="Corethron pennatum, Strain L29A3" /LENGTH=135 /DNA_ID=CAMNT_0039025843 /DNA_START=100 /DNA_END=507 /DNA_ORIENTATION=-